MRSAIFRCKTGIGKTAVNVFLTFYLVISVYPLIWMLMYSFKDNSEIFVTNPFGFPKTIRWENYVRAWTEFDVVTFFLNSVFTTVITIIATILLSLMFSYAIARLEWKFSGFAKLYISIGLFVPVQIILLPLVILAKELHFANTRLSLIIPYIAFELPVSSMIFYGFLRSIPNELEEAAALDGANVYRTFFSIILPMVKPAIATVATFIFLFAWNEFTMAYIMISNNKLKTLPVGLLSFQGQFATDWGAMGAALVIYSIPTILVYVFFSEQIEKSLTAGSALK